MPYKHELSSEVAGELWEFEVDRAVGWTGQATGPIPEGYRLLIVPLPYSKRGGPTHEPFRRSRNGADA